MSAVIDIRSLPGWKTAPRVWRTISPGMSVRVISPAWVEQATRRKSVKHIAENASSSVSRECRLAQIAGEVAERHGVEFADLFQSFPGLTAVSLARHEAWAVMRGECIPIKAMGRFFSVAPSTIRNGIMMHHRRAAK